MTVKINSLEIENIKRVKAVKIEPTPNGLTVLGGRNNQGKSSVLDAIAWALGGNRFKPSEAQREGSVIPPNLKVTLSNGLIVERKGKNSTLSVTDPSGEKANQSLLDSFVEELAINLPKFMQSTSKEKANTLLQIIGVGDQLYMLEQQEAERYNQRRTIGQIADQKEKFAKEMPHFDDVPKELVSPNDLIKQQQEILALNGENQRKRQNLAQITYQKQQADERVAQLKQQLQEALEVQNKVSEDLAIAQKSTEKLQDESTAELEESIANIDEINRKVRTNLDKEKAEDDAKDYRNQYQMLTEEIESIRKEKRDLLSKADLPLPELSVEDGDLIYKGQRWDNMSGSQQLMVSAAIVRKLNPECGFVLIDKLEQMDLQTMQEFGQWLERENLQAIATRVSTGDECTIYIEDGYVVDQEGEAPKTNSWTPGQF